MSTTQDTFTAVSEDTCPHGIDVSDSLLECWDCWCEQETGSMALDDPRREA